MELYKCLLFFFSLSSFLLSSFAIPMTRTFHDSPTTQTLNIVPTMAPSAEGFLSGFFNGPNQLNQKINPALKSICSSTENPDLCASTITPFMSSDSIDPVKALEIEISACLNHTKEVLHTILDLMSDRNTPKDMHDTLDICKDSYDNILDYLKKAVDAFKTKDLGTSQTMLSAVISMYSTCKDAFDESSGVDCPFSTNSEKVYQLAGNSLDIFVTVKPNNN